MDLPVTPPAADTGPRPLPTPVVVGLTVVTTLVLLVANGALGQVQLAYLYDAVVRPVDAGRSPAMAPLVLLLGWSAASTLVFWYAVIKPWRLFHERSLWGAAFPVVGIGLEVLVTLIGVLLAQDLGLQLRLVTPQEFAEGLQRTVAFLQATA